MTGVVAAGSGARAPLLAHLGLEAARPLFLIDVDEVLGLFVQAFGRFAELRGMELRVDGYALFRNLYRLGGAEPVQADAPRRSWQTSSAPAAATWSLRPARWTPWRACRATPA
jgi:hypothetical protein